MTNFPLEKISTLKKELETHPIYDALQNIDDLTLFMQHHVYSVWDFMSLVKYLQRHISPVRVPWSPSKHIDVERFINEISLEEGYDENISYPKYTRQQYISHFDLYIESMEEIEKESSVLSKKFVSAVEKHSLSVALETVSIPSSSKDFMESTFSFIKSDKPHVVAAAFAFGREHIIPGMFHSLLQKMNIQNKQTEKFYYYLDRHIELDQNNHAPMAMKMLEILCENNPIKIIEAEEAAIRAINARIKLWDEVLECLKNAMHLQ